MGRIVGYQLPANSVVKYRFKQLLHTLNSIRRKSLPTSGLFIPCHCLSALFVQQEVEQVLDNVVVDFLKEHSADVWAHVATQVRFILVLCTFGLKVAR